MEQIKKEWSDLSEAQKGKIFAEEICLEAQKHFRENEKAKEWILRAALEIRERGFDGTLGLAIMIKNGDEEIGWVWRAKGIENIENRLKSAEMFLDAYKEIAETAQFEFYTVSEKEERE